ncbi:MAG: MoaD/ThiS family protein [Bauldia sp.]|nr:MoaD/ThiS family protein [Bauldia sp.]
MTMRYFASVREGLGIGEESIDLPSSVATVGDLLKWLPTRGPAYDATIREGRAIRAAVDRVHAKEDTPILGAREVALFPMMTGG